MKSFVGISLRFYCLFFVFALLVLFSFSALNGWLVGYSWHDQQRIFQLVLLVVVAPFSLLVARQVLSDRVLFCVAMVFIFGAISTSLSAFPEWALKEWVRYVGLFLLVVVLAGSKGYQFPVVLLITFVGGVNSWQFFLYYVMAFVSGVYDFSPVLLFNGFDNPRFLGQFQVLLLPVLMALCVYVYSLGRLRSAQCLFLVMSFQWCIVFSLGGRGVIAALLVSHVLLLFVRLKFWRLCAVQVCSAIFGFFLLKILFVFVPIIFGLDPASHSNVLRGGLSARGELWWTAYEMALANPFFGVGPMHFSASLNLIAAHPHQAVLQFLAEWGFPVVCLIFYLVWKGLLRGGQVLVTDNASLMDVGVWLGVVSALVLSQVDGVFVMPYTETWLAVFVGVLVSRWSTPLESSVTQKSLCAVLVMPVVIILGAVLLKEVPVLSGVEEAYIRENASGWKPRFWLQGRIPM